jgi:hypothetical protein
MDEVSSGKGYKNSRHSRSSLKNSQPYDRNTAGMLIVDSISRIADKIPFPQPVRH